MMDKLWKVTYEYSRAFTVRKKVEYFASERSARIFYKKVCGMQGFVSGAIKHLVDDNVGLLIRLVMEHPELDRAWKKLPAAVRTRILKKQQAAVIEILEEVVCRS